jgi:hypothetical protein
MIIDCKRTVKSIGFLWTVSMLFLGCATIFGGPNYNSQVWVNGRPKAEIIYGGEIKGKGAAFILVSRRDANKFSVTIRENGCQEQTFYFKSRRFRAGTLLGGIPGVLVDLIMGSIWKPNVNENGVSKLNYKSFHYIINYTGCSSSPEKGKEGNPLIDVLYLKNGSIIKGTLMESDSVSQIKIQMTDGSIFVFRLDEVLKVE